MAKPLGTRSPAHIEAQAILENILEEYDFKVSRGEEKAAPVITGRGVLNQQIDVYGERNGVKLGIEVMGRVGHKKTTKQYYRDLHRAKDQNEQNDIHIASLNTEDVVGKKAHPKEILVAEIEHQTGISL